MNTRVTAIGVICFGGIIALPPITQAVPVPTDPKKDAADRADFIPQRKHQPLPGKIVGVLLADAQPVLSTEGRSGPPDQLCFGVNGGSYRWVYVSVPERAKATIGTLQIPIPGNKRKAFDKLSMASPETTKRFGITAAYTLVEIEVNAGLGSPADDSFVASDVKPLDGTKEYPLKLTSVVDQLRKQYESHLSEKAKDLDAAMDDAAKKALKDRKPTGPRERSTLMFLSWMPEADRLHVRFLTKITDGAYQYGGGIPIDLGPVPQPVGPAQGGPAQPPKLPEGLRYGTQFGVEYGVGYEVTRNGTVDKTKTLEAKSFEKELPPPPALGRPKPVPLPVPDKL